MSATLDRLTALASLRERGLVSPDEYTALKSRILAEPERPARAETGPPPDSPMLFCVLATVFGCWPIGLVAIVKASQVSTLWYCGQRVQAEESAASARAWGAASLAVGVVLFILVVAMLAATRH